MAIINGTISPNDILGTLDPDVISGDAGNDTIDGWGGNDTLSGDADNDFIRGGAGDDSIDGGDGNDSLEGNTGDDFISGGAGNDTLEAGAGNDILAPGLGEDVVFDGGGKNDLLVVDYSASTTAVTMAAPTLIGPVIVGSQPPNGSVSNNGWYTVAGGFNSFFSLDPAQYEKLWWTPLIIGAAMDGTIDDPGEMMSFASAVGDVLTYIGTTTVQTADGPVPIFTKYVLTLQSGGQAWATAASSNVFGGGEYATQVDGATLQVNEQFLASTTLDGTYVAMSDLYTALQGIGGSATTTSRGFFAFDDGGFTSRIEDGEGNAVGFNGMERFDIRSGSGDDDITTAEGDDIIRSVGGNDAIAGRGGSDTLDGGSGNDSIDGGAGADSMEGGAGDDTYWVDDAGDAVVELDGEGADRVGASVSYVLGEHLEHLSLIGSDAIDGTGNALANDIAGNDAANELSGGAGNDTLSGMDGDDSLLGGDGDDSLSGEAGNDRLAAGAGADVVVGGAGDADLLVVDYSASTTAVTLVGPALAVDGASGVIADAEGNSTSFSEVERFDIRSGGGADDIHTGGGNDSIASGSGDDSIRGGVGNDTVTGGGGLDALYGEAGADVLRGGAGSDVLAGGGGGDTLMGGSGADTLIGSGGNDVLDGGAGPDSLEGGAGADVYFVNELGDSVHERARAGADQVNTTLASYTLGANLENLLGSGGAGQALTGNALANVITAAGGAGADVLKGRDGDDTLTGGGGNDLLVGGAGRDVLNGGAGADVFDYNALSDSGLLSAQQDLIEGFQHGRDRIDLSTLDARPTANGNQAFAFIGSAAFTAAGQVRVVQAGDHTLLEVNTAGTGGAEMVIRLAGSVALAAGDLIL